MNGGSFIIQSHKKEITNFIKNIIKDNNPEPFLGYNEISNAT